MESSKAMISTDKDDIWLDDRNNARIKVKPNFEYDENDLNRHFKAYSKLGIGIKNRTYLIVDASEKGNYIMPSAARNVSAKRSKDFFFAGAIISNSVVMMTLVNVLSLFYNYKVPMKLFSNEKDALAWIEELKSKEILDQIKKSKKESILN